jgi:peptidoglycan/LPS O-acetylase OafA/YrhL
MKIMVQLLTVIARLQDKFYKFLSALISCTSAGKYVLASFQKLQLYKILSSSDRISSLDIFRAIAIVVVLFYHFHHRLRYGLLGVDLFFVISGLLVGGILTKEFLTFKKINMPRFLLQRGFKIWPSYYFFLSFGSILAFVFYRNSHPDQSIPWFDLPRYLFFYENFVDLPVHWSFDHVWSLCVEEHFYIFLPTCFILIQVFAPEKSRVKALYALVAFAIIAGIAFKYFSYFDTASHDTYLGTQNRIDALAWGVLLNLILSQYGERLKQVKWLPLLSLVGLTLFIMILHHAKVTDNEVYQNIILHSVIPPCFFMLILGVYYQDFSRFYFLRTLGYLSYNLYLWHPIFVNIVSDDVTTGRLGLIVYLIAVTIMAALATLLIEEPFLKMRKSAINKIFKK